MEEPIVTNEHSYSATKENEIFEIKRETSTDSEEELDVTNCYHETAQLPPTPPSDDSSIINTVETIPKYYGTPAKLTHHNSHHQPYIQPVFIPTSGVLILTDEEKRTLIQEGFPIPTKLPLTKQEEKNLKKIRRKIKNKISAQESRRKKKEYVDNLEKRMEDFVQENHDLKRKVESLENHNKSLLQQLTTLQSVVTSSGCSQTAGTCFMVIVLCFAFFIGGFSPLKAPWNIGYSINPSFKESKQPFMPSPNIRIEMGPKLVDAKIDAYLIFLGQGRLLEERGPLLPSHVARNVRDQCLAPSSSPNVPNTTFSLSSNVTIVLS
ncbi:DgyrCDS13290 [Dimorphilus gyrociliatus]|uniref:DgyrCDS13290 n=1 Tax=Dimorphilus gyrociliatus TaxID=2664684 RepID=A0A7I8WAC2_9ANNE|nr:DgyrCDS13290 [Dimorphilus gyrociliatus]